MKYLLCCFALLAVSACGPGAGPDDGSCDNSCRYANDGECDDGRPGADYNLCDYGTDDADCDASCGDSSPGGSCIEAGSSTNCLQSSLGCCEGDVCLTDTGLCHAYCSSPGDCNSGCCVELESGRGACADSTFCF